MFRRQFIQLVTLAGVGGFASAGAVARETKSVTYRVQGFSCITCATGLDVMLQREAGVVRAESSYQDARTTIVYDPHRITEAALRQSITSMGFGAEQA